MKFRYHRGSYSESMATVKEFDTIDDMVAFLKKENPRIISVTAEEYSGIDTRNNWNTHIVSVEYSIGGNKYPIGFCTPPEFIQIKMKNGSVLKGKKTNPSGLSGNSFNWLEHY